MVRVRTGSISKGDRIRETESGGGDTMKKDNKVQYVVQKLVIASSVKEALRKEKHTEVHGVWIDKEWVEQKKQQLNPAIGFAVETQDDEE